MHRIQSKRIPLSGVAVSMQGGRPENQDYLNWTDTPLGFLLVVCDGMGGGPGGKTASYMATTEVLTAIGNSSPQASRVEALKRAVSQANDALYRRQDEVPSLRGMGSTLVAVLVNEHSAVIAHLGDSRCYQIRGSRIVFRTQDHSLVGEMVRNKALTEEQARVSPQSNVIMRGLGNTSNHVPEITERPYQKGDRFVVCTDGVWGIMPHEQLAQRLTSAQDLAAYTGNLSAEVDQIGFASGGHHDNHTLAVVEMNTDSILKDKMNGQTKTILGLLAVLLVISLLFNVVSLFGRVSRSELDALTASLSEKTAKISELEGYQQLYQEVKEAGSKELITKVEVLEFEKASLEQYINELMEKVDSLDRVVSTLSAKTTAQGSAAASNDGAQVLAQKAINRIQDIKKITEKDYAKSLSMRAKLRKEAVHYLDELNAKTSRQHAPTLDAVKRELEHPKSEALLISQAKDKSYVSTQTAIRKIDQLTEKLNQVKNKCKK